MRGKWVLIAVAAVLAGAGGGALSQRYRREPPPRVRSAAAAIAAPQGTFSGKIRPQHITAVPAAVNGNIEAFMVEVGQDVYEGQVLARIGAAALESTRDGAASASEQAQERVVTNEAVVKSAILEASRADADAARARTALTGVERTYSRQRTLVAAGATPRIVFDKAQRDYEAAQAEFAVADKAARAAHEQVESAQQQLGLARKQVEDAARQLEGAQEAVREAEVRAPVDGMVVVRNGEVGKSVEEAGGDLFQIATDIYALEVAIDPPPAELARIRPGQPALILVLDLQSSGIPGQVKAINGSQVVVEFTSTVPAIRPGMRADVRLKLD